jgi:IMP dehydrogenase
MVSFAYLVRISKKCEIETPKFLKCVHSAWIKGESSCDGVSIRRRQMTEDIGTLLITQDQRIIAQRDIDLAGEGVSDLLVSDLMTRTLIKAKEATPLRWIVEKMIRTGIQRIPVVDEKSKLLGLVTQTCVIKATLVHDPLK